MWHVLIDRSDGSREHWAQYTAREQAEENAKTVHKHLTRHCAVEDYPDVYAVPDLDEDEFEPWE